MTESNSFAGQKSDRNKQDFKEEFDYDFKASVSDYLFLKNVSPLISFNATAMQINKAKPNKIDEQMIDN